MRKKKLISLIAVIALISIGIIYNNRLSVDNSLDNKSESTVVEVNKIKVKSSFIRDEEAVDIAKKAIKDYMDVDISKYKNISISRQDSSKDTTVTVDGEMYTVSKKYAKWIQEGLDIKDLDGARKELKIALKERPNIITVVFGKKGLYKRNFEGASVDIDADTKEILSIFIHNNFEECTKEPDKDKIKEVVMSFLNNINKEVNEEEILSKCDIDLTIGKAILSIELTNGNIVSIDVNLNDYSVVTYIEEGLRYSN